MLEIGSILSEPSTWMILTIGSIYFIYRRGTSNFNVFSNQGIPGPKPTPFVGNAWGMWKKNIPENGRKMVKEYGNVFGTFLGTSPTLHVNDTEIIKSVFIKDFDHFVNRRKAAFPEIKVLRYLLFGLENQKWKDIRSTVTPTFTTGKIKRYSIQMKECTDRLCTNFKSIIASKGKLNLKEEMSVVTMAIIAKCAFGMNLDNLGKEDDPFMKNAKKIFGAPQNKKPAIMLRFLMPSFIIGQLAPYFFDISIWNFFIDIMENMLERRSKTTEKFHDFPESTAEAITNQTKNENGKTVPAWNKEEVLEIIAAQATLFLVAGYDTTSNTLTAAMFELARHPELQQKLYDQIMSKVDQHGGVCHELLEDVPYLDHIMHEVLRMHPPVTFLERQCNKPVTYNGIHISKGMVVNVSTYALHYSEEYYTDPETFNPDRWNSENKASLNPYAYMPFGLGPRNCIAMRFAQEEVKLVLCSLVKEFRFFPVEETPAKFTVEDGFNNVSVPNESVIGIAARA